ncbi:MAG: hypothetical protein ACREEE_15820, partial [Dongiaceae bacterium]
DVRRSARESDVERQDAWPDASVLGQPAADFDTPGQKPKAPQRPLDGGAPRGNVNQASRMEHLRMLMKIAGLSPASQEAAREMAANLELSENTVNSLGDPARNIDLRREQEFLNAVAEDPVLVGAMKNWSTTSAQGPSSPEVAARRIVDHHARTHGYSMPKVVFENLPLGRSGEHRPFQNSIAIDTEDLHERPAVRALGTVTHEAMHAYTTQLMRDLAAGRISVADPRYPLLQMLRFNDRFYTLPDGNADRYARQPWETYANSTKAPLADLVRELGKKRHSLNYQR